jgi:hypothetical protein
MRRSLRIFEKTGMDIHRVIDGKEIEMVQEEGTGEGCSRLILGFEFGI